jgi:uncharacterized protein (DUF2141 family)
MKGLGHHAQRRITMLGIMLTAQIATTLSPVPATPSEAQSASSAIELSGTITARMRGFKNDSGQVFVVVFDQAKGFPGKRQKAVRRAFRPIHSGAVTVNFDDLPPGDYAIAFVHDENANRHLDLNAVGFPQEGIGVSNEDRLGRRFPTFKRTKFRFDDTRHVETMHVKYL